MKIKLLALGALFASLCASVQGQVIDKTPLFHLSFDNVSGTTVINDGTGGSAMNGTLNGTATIVAGGKFGNALSVTGVNASDASVRVANAVVPLNVGAGQPAWSVAMWFQTTTPGGCYAYQGSGGWAGGNTMFYLTSGRSGGGTSGTHAGAVRNGQEWEEGTTDVNDGLWHHFVLTFDGTTKVMYLDGHVETFDENNWPGDGTGNQFWIGGNPYDGDGSVNLNGLIDEVYVFNRALSPSDVAALNDSNNVPTVPVVATVNPTSGYRGQVFTVTATATPAVGTVTNATANLSALGLPSSANLGQSSANVFTNSFTVPATAPIGVANVKVTVTSTEPLAGSGGTTFTVLARPPTNATVVTQITNTSVYEYSEASFHFGTTNDAPDPVFAMTYAWYTNSVLVSTNPMGPDYTFLTTPANSGMSVYAIARVADTNFSSISVTSAVVTLTVNTGPLVYTNGLKRELFANVSRQQVEIGDVPAGRLDMIPAADVGLPDFNNTINYVERLSGYFVPPADGAYVFFINSDDDSDLFLSTDNNPDNKRLIAQETVWSNPYQWLADSSTFGSVTQKRSDQWSPDGGVTTPWASGFTLTGGQKYYLEVVHHQGGGGGNVAVTYQTTTEIADPNWSINFTNGAPPLLNSTNGNLALVTWPGTTIQWSVQPVPSLTVFEGQTTNFSAIAISDAEMLPNYQWFIVTNGGAFPGTPLTGPVAGGTNVTLSTIPFEDNAAQIYCVASTEEGSLSITSSVATLTVQQAVFESGWVSEKKWMDIFNIGGAESGSIGAPTFTCVRPGYEVGLDNPGTYPHDSTLQQAGYFVAPSNGNYVFFITSHDGGDLFLSTDNTPANKRRVAQELGWSNNWLWNQASGGGSVVTQKRSDQYSPDGGITTPYAAGIPMVAGHRYYMEVDHTTSRWGNEQVGVTYRVMQGGSVTPPADGSFPNCIGSVVGMNAIRCSYVAFTQQPVNVTSHVMGYATFSAAGATDSQYPTCSPYGYTIVAPTNALFFQWFTNGVAVAGATSATFSMGPLLPSDNNTLVSCKMRALGFADDSLNPIWTNSQTATLTVTGQTVFEPGVAWVDWWTNITSLAAVEGGSVAQPSFSYAVPKFAAPTENAPSLYVNRVSAMFMPPTNGNYAFFVNSDDDSDLFLNTTGPSPAGRTLVAQQTSWSGTFQWLGGGGSLTQKRSDQWSPDGGATVPYATGIPLTGGQKYWLEGVHHDTGGGNNFEATYKGIFDQDPANGSDTKLAGSVIGIYVPRIPWVAFLQQPTDQTQTSGGNPVTFTVQGTNPPSIWIGTTGNPFNWLSNPPTASLQYQWYKRGVPIPGANSASYTQPYVLPSDQGAQFVCGLRALGYSDDGGNRIYSNSVAAVLTVVTDTVPPNVIFAAAFQNTNTIPPKYIVNVTFSKWMDPSTLTDITHYSIAGVNVTNAIVASNHRTVELQLDAMPTLPLVVNVTGVTDLSGNALATSSTSINPVKLTFTDVGFPPYYDYAFGQLGYDPSYPSIISVVGNGGYIVSAEGSDIYGTADGFDFGWEAKTNDFDVVVRGVSNGHSSNWAKMGLIVREDLSAGGRSWDIVNTPNPADGIMAPDNSGFGANVVLADTRETISAATVSWLTRSSPAPAYPNAWLRIKRTISGTNDVLSGYYSTNGMNWIQIASYDTSTNASGSLSNVVLVGICTTAHNNDIATTTPAPPPVYYNTAEFADYNSAYVPTIPATLSVSRSGTDVIVSWTPAAGHLESSPAISGPSVNWQTVTSSNPATIPIGSGMQFFRVVTP